MEQGTETTTGLSTKQTMKATMTATVTDRDGCSGEANVEGEARQVLHSGADGFKVHVRY